MHSEQIKGLPPAVVTTSDIDRLLRELRTIDDSLLQLKLRKGKDNGEIKLPKITQLMDRITELNQLNLLHQDERQLLRTFLEAVKESAPILHMSFGTDPSAAFLEQLILWLRREIHPVALLTIGLQPNIGAGCVVRTANRQFDFSLGKDFARKRELLISKLVPPGWQPVLLDPVSPLPAGTAAVPAAREPA